MKRGEQDFTHKYIHREVYEKLKVAEKKWWVDKGALGFTKWRGGFPHFHSLSTAPKKTIPILLKKKEPVNNGSGHVFLFREGKKPET